MKIVRGRLTADSLEPANTRWDDTCECVQTTPDGGTTWNDTPSADPRYNPAGLKPALSSGDVQCDSAANAVKWIKDFIDDSITALGAGATAFTLANIALGFWELIFGEVGLLVSLLFEVGTTLFTAGESVLSGAFDSTVYDYLLCAIYCNLDSSGRMTAETFANMIVIVNDGTINSTAAAILNLILNSQGEIGVSNAAAIGSETGDCSACVCDHCYKIDFLVQDGVAAGFHLQGGTHLTGSPLVSIDAGAGNRGDLWGYWAFPSTLFVKSYVIEFYKAAGSGGNDINRQNTLYPTATGYSTVLLGQDTSNPKMSNTRQTKTMTPNTNLAGVGFDINTGNTVNTNLVYSLTIVYAGAEVFGGDNC